MKNKVCSVLQQLSQLIFSVQGHHTETSGIFEDAINYLFDNNILYITYIL